MIRDPGGAIVYVVTTTWQGISFGARHWYGNLKTDDVSHELTAPLTQKHCAILNKELRDGGYNMQYWAGAMYAGFLSLEELYAAAIREWNGPFPNGRALIVSVGNNSSINPKYILELDSVEKDSLNAIWEISKDMNCDEQWPYTIQWEQQLALALDLEYEEWK